MSIRQQVLYLWADGSSLDSRTIGWAFHDGTNGEGSSIPEGKPPYANGVEAIRAGWMLMQSTQVPAVDASDPHRNSYLQYEFVFERREDVDLKGD